MRTSELEYDFDPSLVATTPATPRDSARMMVVDRARGTIDHRHVRDLPSLLRRGDQLLLNDTSVLRARVRVRDPLNGRESEGLLLSPCAEPHRWRMLLRQSKRFAPETVLSLVDHDGHERDDALVLIARDDDTWIVDVRAGKLGGDVAEVLERSGHTPIPPYIRKAREAHSITVSDDLDRSEYETVYANRMDRGSVAAPTAGFHFTDALLDTLANGGIGRANITLHVGAGTFKPVDTETLAAHAMHSESFTIPAVTIALLETLAVPRVRGEARIVAVGTTTVRALESLPSRLPTALDVNHAVNHAAYHANTSILIAPGFEFRFVDALITNFHLPRSTLLALVGAFAGMELMHEAYRIAVRERYRFYSFGDAMLIL